MSEIRHRDRILEAIDQLRKRKARPDVNRICSFMFRRFAVNCVETKLDLQKLIDAEIVIKVDYKGNTSYRNAAKWAMLPAYKYKKEIDTSTIISSAVAELIVLEPDYLDIGVPEFELDAHMAQKDNRRFSKKNLDAILKREVEIGTLVKLENGNYFLGEHSSMNSNSTMDRPSATNVGNTAKQQTTSTNKPSLSPRLASRPRKIKIISKYNDNSNDSDKMKPDEQLNNSESANVGFRVGGRQKRARIVFDPSDNNLPTRVKKRGPGRPLGSLNKSTIINNATSGTTPPASAPTTPVNKPTVTTPTATPVKTAAIISNTSVPPPVKPFNKTFDIANPPVNPGLCFRCHSYGQRIKGVPEKLIPCSYCTNRVHPSCLEVGEDVPNRDGAWQCSQCKRCSVCDEAGTLVVCVVCRDAYHHQCHSPPVTERARAKQLTWHCAKCSPIPEPISTPPKETLPVKEGCQITSTKKEAVTPPMSPQPRVRDVPANCLQDPFEDIPIDETIPDAKHWTTNQVYQYLSSHLKPELAQVFKDQDIDGQSLLLMKRMDILTGLNLKVGPALKVYKQVKILQTRKNHPRLFWS